MAEYIERESLLREVERDSNGRLVVPVRTIHRFPAADVAPVRWTSVDERLPHAEYGESDSVLVVTELGSMQVLYFDGGNWCYPTGEPFVRTKFRVTHWMPLPEPPEGKNEM